MSGVPTKRRGGRRDDNVTEGVQTFEMTAAELYEHLLRVDRKSAEFSRRYGCRRCR